MIVLYSDVFLKSSKKLNDKIAVKRLYELIEKLEKATTLWEIANVVPVKGSSALFRIRTGDYRLIVEYWDGKLTILLLDYLKRNEKTYKGFTR